MSHINPTLIDELLADKKLGAGNFVYKIFKLIGDDAPLIFTDIPFVDYNKYVRDSFSISYIVEAANWYAAYYHKVGVSCKDPVLLYFDESINYFIQFVSLTSFGAIPAFINGALEPSTSVALARSANAKYLVTNGHRIKALQSILDSQDQAIKLINIDDVALSDGDERPFLYNHGDEDTVLLAHTSGTTGLPKLVQFTHASMFVGIRNQLKKFPGERIFSVLPHSHASSITILISSFLKRSEIMIQAQKNATAVLEVLESYRPDLVVAFPKVFVDMCRYNLNDYDLGSIQYWLSTGDANHEPHIRKLIANGCHWKDGKKYRGSMFIDNLGSSEFSYAMFRNRHTIKSNNYDRCIGVPFDWVECAILGEDGSQVKLGEVGYLGVKAASVTKGYWNNSNMTEKNRLGGFWLTGDLAYQDGNGIFYHVDRVSDKIDVKEGTLYSCQAEEWILKNLPSVFEISFVGIENESNQKTIIAMVELTSGYDAIDLNVLREQINSYLSNRMWPSISKVKLQSAYEDSGVTGKKLKRKIRQEYSAKQ